MKPNMQARSLFLSMLAAAALAACSDSSDPTEGLTGTAGFKLLSASNPIDITPDGQTVVAEEFRSPQGNLYFYDVATGNYTLKTKVGSTFLDFATGVSGDLKVSALYGEPVQAGVWSEATGWTVIPSTFPAGCDPQVGGAWDISTDGLVMVGLDWNGCTVQAMRWTEAAGTWTSEPLELIGSNYPDNPNPANNRATVVSGNGQVAAGWASTEVADRRPAVWQADGSGSFLAAGVTDDLPGEVLSINDDGSIMAGVWGGQGFIWTAGTANFIESLPSDDPFAVTAPNAIAANGQLVFGGSGGQAFVWTAAGGTRSLQEVATAWGVMMEGGLTLQVVKAASADGTIVIGQAYNKFKNFTFVLKLPVSAYGL